MGDAHDRAARPDAPRRRARSRSSPTCTRTTPTPTRSPPRSRPSGRLLRPVADSRRVPGDRRRAGAPSGASSSSASASASSREWETVTVGAFTRDGDPGGRRLRRRRRSRWIVEADGVRVFHGGDTLFHGWWWRAKMRAGGPIDYAFLPANGPRRLAAPPPAGLAAQRVPLPRRGGRRGLRPAGAGWRSRSTTTPSTTRRSTPRSTTRRAVPGRVRGARRRRRRWWSRARSFLTRWSAPRRRVALAHGHRRHRTRSTPGRRGCARERVEPALVRQAAVPRPPAARPDPSPAPARPRARGGGRGVPEGPAHLPERARRPAADRARREDPRRGHRGPQEARRARDEGPEAIWRPWSLAGVLQPRADARRLRALVARRAAERAPVDRRRRAAAALRLRGAEAGVAAEGRDRPHQRVPADRARRRLGPRARRHDRRRRRRMARAMC